MLDKANLSVEETMAAVSAVAGRRQRRWYVAGLLTVLLLLVLVIVWQVGGTDAITVYQTRPVQFGSLKVTVSATGNLAATNEVEVGSELSGIIKRMTAEDNDTVTAGQPLAYLDDAKYNAAVMKSRAEVASAKAAYQEAVATRKVQEKKVQRYRKTRELTGGKLPSMEDLEQAEADLERAVASVRSAAAAIEIANATLSSNEADLKKTVIYAPISGVVLSRDVEPGQTVAASMQAPVLYTLAQDLRHMVLKVDVDEADVGLVKEGQSADFTVDAYPDRTFTASITRVKYGAVTTDGVVTYETTLKVENPDLLLRPGMTATADITVMRLESTLLVPNAALRFAPAQPTVEKKDRRSLVDSLLPRPPRPGTQKKKAAEISSATGDRRMARVWILKEDKPVPVAVKTVATDSAMTAVSSEDLHEGDAVVVRSLSERS